MNNKTDIFEWLREHRFEKYQDVFRKAEITIENLPEITYAKLADLKIPLHPRKRILKQIDLLKQDTQLSDQDQLSNQIKPPEMRYVSVLMCDIVNSSGIASSVSLENFHSLIDSFRALSERVVESHKYKGEIQQDEGDGLLAYFGFPVAHENDAERALRCAIEILDGFHDLSVPGVSRVRGRIGISTGIVAVSQKTGPKVAGIGGPVGLWVNIAKRLQTIASAGEILICEQTRLGLRENWNLADLGDQELEKIEEPVRTWLVRGLDIKNIAQSNGDIQNWVGRKNELNKLKTYWPGERGLGGSTVWLHGRAGIGKSTLLQKFSRAAIKPNGKLITLNCSSFTENSAFHPILVFLRNIINARHTQTELALSAKQIDQFLRLLNTKLTKHSDALCAVLGITKPASGFTRLDNETRKQRIVKALTSILFEYLKGKGTLLIIEDIHWVDASSAEIVQKIFKSASKKSYMCIAASRTLDHPYLNSNECDICIELDKLSDTESRHLLYKSLGDKAIEKHDHYDEILHKSAGVPLYLVEIIRSHYLSSGHFDLDTKQPISQILQGTFLERIDSLAEEYTVVKAITQISATFGERISPDILHELLPKTSFRLIRHILSLLVTERIMVHERVDEKDFYSFRHALLRDAVYQSILHSGRKKIHLEIGTFLELCIKGDQTVQEEIIALHMQKARRYISAARWWALAAEKSTAIAALFEAINQYTEALNQLEKSEDIHESESMQLDCLLALGDVYRSHGGTASEEARECFERAKYLAPNTQGSAKIAHLLYGYFVTHFSNSDFEMAYRAIDDLKSLGKLDSSSGVKSIGLQAQGITEFALGKFINAEKSLLKSLTNGQSIKDVSTVNHSQFPFTANAYLAWTYFILGLERQGNTRIKEGLYYLNQGTPFQQALFLANICYVYQWLEDEPSVLKHAKYLEQLSTKYKLSVWLSIAQFFLAWHAVRQGGYTKNMPVIADFINNTGPHDRAYFLTVAAELSAQVQEFGTARNYANRAISEATASNEKWILAEAYRVLALSYIAEGNSQSDYVQITSKALTIAESQGASLWYLKTKRMLSLEFDQRDPNFKKNTLPNCLDERPVEPSNTFIQKMPDKRYEDNQTLLKTIYH